MSSTARTTNAADDRRTSVPLNMIVRDEEDHLPGCLASVADLFDELIIVDTGSADRTTAIAHAAVDRHSRRARVIEFSWTNSFADARNEAIRHSTGERIFSIDADERIDEPNRRKLAELFGSLSDRRVAYRASVYAALPDGGFFPALGYTKLFPNRADLRWFGRIHEGLKLPGDMMIRVVRRRLIAYRLSPTGRLGGQISPQCAPARAAARGNAHERNRAVQSGEGMLCDRRA